MSDLGPFAIRRIEPGVSPDAPVVTPVATPASSLLTRAAEVYADRVSGAVERDSPADAQITDALRTRSAAIDAEALTPLLGRLAGPPALTAPRDASAPPIDPSADAMRTSVFHPLADLASTPDTQEKTSEVFLRKT